MNRIERQSNLRFDMSFQIQKMAGISKPLYTQQASKDSIYLLPEQEKSLNLHQMEVMDQISPSEKMSLPSHLSSCPSENLNQKQNNNARPFTSLGQTRNAMNQSNYPNNESYRSNHKTERCKSTQPRMKFGYMTHTNYRFKPQINRLAIPKATPTQHSQFNGLLQTKHPDAIRNCSSFKHKKSFDLFQESRNMNKTYIQGSRLKTSLGNGSGSGSGVIYKNMGIINSLASQTGFSQKNASLTLRRLSKSVKDVFPIPRSAVGTTQSGVKNMKFDQDQNYYSDGNNNNNNNKLKVTVSMGDNTAITDTLVIARPSTSLGINASKISSIHQQSLNSTTNYQSRQAYGAGVRYSNLNEDNSRGVIQERDTISQDDFMTRTTGQKSKKAIYKNQEAEETFDLMKQFEKTKRCEILSNKKKGYPRIQFESQMNNGGRGISEDQNRVSKDKRASSIAPSQSNIHQIQSQIIIKQMSQTSKQSLGPISQILGTSSSILSLGGKAGTQIHQSKKMLMQRQQLDKNTNKIASSMKGLYVRSGQANQDFL